MGGTINTYLGMCIVAIVGAAAALLIIHVANGNSLSSTIGGSEATYAPLEQSILKP